MRLALFAAALLLSPAVAALAQEASAPAAVEAATDAAPPEAPKARKIKYVNEKGEELICKTVSGSTGTRLKNRGKLICGTEAEWNDADSRMRRLFDELITRNTPSPRG
jgi:ABC-type amino acid transport substrate-binding protein